VSFKESSVLRIVVGLEILVVESPGEEYPRHETDMIVHEMRIKDGN
jgi:hypothetical protein